MADAPLAQRLAEYAATLQFDALDEPSIHEVRRRLVDSLACSLGACDAPAVGAARRLAARVSARPGAQFLAGSDHRTSPDLAAFVNGVAVRYLDYNDTYLSLEPAHPSDNIPAVLAAAQIANAGGAEVVTAIVLAYEIQCRLCDAASLRTRGWDHVTYGAFSVSASVARLLGLSAQQIQQAIQLAGVPNIALRQTRSGELSEWKGCAFANVARNGIVAALLAAEGLTGPAPLFEGEMGFFKQVSGPFDLPVLGGGPGDSDGHDFMIKRTSIKFWPAEYHSQSAIHAALQLRPQIGDPQRIRQVDIYSFDAAVDIIGKDPEKWRPRTRETADHSLPYCTAVALVDGDVTLESFSDERLADAGLLDLVGRIRVHRDRALTARYPQGIPNRLEVTLDDGTRLVAENEFPRGHARNPLSDEELEAKFRRMADDRLDAPAQERLLELCWSIDKLDDVDELMSVWTAARPAK